jgi:hypothetical protein
MENSNQILKALYGNNNVSSFIMELESMLKEARCDVHGGDESWNVHKMYIYMIDPEPPQFRFIITDDCCCPEFGKLLTLQVNQIIDNQIDKMRV